MPAVYQNPLFWIISFLFLAQCGLYLVLFRRLAAYKVREKEDSAYPPFSVIIAARNEEDNLRVNLPVILSQEYPKYEVIVVDDQSDDESKYLLEDLEKEYPNLKVVRIEEHVREFAGKKLALTLGIKAASHEHLLFTDADCQPGGPHWISRMAESYDSAGTSIVLGYSPYKSSAGFLNAFIRFDTYYTALQYFSFALAGNPYMGVGRNLSYKRSLFLGNKGFAPFLKVASGDDDLFVNTHANGSNTNMQLHPDSFVWSEPEQSWGEWLGQKRRHLSTGKLYKTKHKRALGLVWLSHFLFLISIIPGIIFIKPWWVAPAIYGLRLAVQWPVAAISMRKLGTGSLWPVAPFLEIFYQLVYLPFMGFASLVTKSRRRW